MVDSPFFRRPPQTPSAPDLNPPASPPTADAAVDGPVRQGDRGGRRNHLLGHVRCQGQVS
eukprot:1788620-Rhodomonas_salina.1